MKKINVLVVGDYPAFLRTFSFWLETILGECCMTCATSGPEALIWLEHNSPDLVLTDLQMPGMNGFELANHVKFKSAAIAVVVMSVSGCSGRTDMPAWMSADQCMDKSTIYIELPRFLEQRFGITMPPVPPEPDNSVL